MHALKDGAAAVENLFDRLTLPIVAPSPGDVETQITRLAITSHAGLTAGDVMPWASQAVSDGFPLA